MGAGPYSLAPQPMALDKTKVNALPKGPKESTLKAKLKAAWNAGALWLACALSCSGVGAKAQPCQSQASRSRALSGAPVMPVPDSSWKGAGAPLKSAQVREVGEATQSAATRGAKPAPHSGTSAAGNRAQWVPQASLHCSASTPPPGSGRGGAQQCTVGGLSLKPGALLIPMWMLMLGQPHTGCWC